jgi:protein-disulfide isomerase
VATPTKKEQRQQAREAREAREAEERAAAQRKRRLLQLGGALAAAAVIVVIAVVVSSGGGGKKGGSSKGAATGSTDVTQLLNGIPQSNLTLGNPKAPVTVIEFADLKCPFCQDYTLNTQPDIVKRYVRTGKVRFEWRNLAFVGNDPADTQAAALATLAAGKQDKLWNFADVFYRNQGNESTTYVTDAFIKKIASGVPGLDVNKLLKDRTSAEVQQELAVAQQDASKMGADSTPTFFIKKGAGAPVKAPNFQTLAQEIDKALGVG